MRQSQVSNCRKLIKREHERFYSQLTIACYQRWCCWNLAAWVGAQDCTCASQHSCCHCWRGEEHPFFSSFLQKMGKRWEKHTFFFFSPSRLPCVPKDGKNILFFLLSFQTPMCASQRRKLTRSQLARVSDRCGLWTASPKSREER